MLAGNTKYDTEPEFAAAIKAGNKGAFRQLYTRFAPMVLGFMQRVAEDNQTAEDLLQKTFLMLWEDRASATTLPLIPWVLATSRTAMRLHQATEQQMAPPPSALSTDSTSVLEEAWYDGCTVDELSKRFGAGQEEIKIMLRNAVNKYKKQTND